MANSDEIEKEVVRSSADRKEQTVMVEKKSNDVNKKRARHASTSSSSSDDFDYTKRMSEIVALKRARGEIVNDMGMPIVKTVIAETMKAGEQPPQAKLKKHNADGRRKSQDAVEKWKRTESAPAAKSGAVKEKKQPELIETSGARSPTSSSNKEGVLTKPTWPGSTTKTAGNIKKKGESYKSERKSGDGLLQSRSETVEKRNISKSKVVSAATAAVISSRVKHDMQRDESLGVQKSSDRLRLASLAAANGGPKIPGLKAASGHSRILTENFVQSTLRRRDPTLAHHIPSTRCPHRMSDPAQRLNSFLEMVNFPLESVPYYLEEIHESRQCREGLLERGHSVFSELSSIPPLVHEPDSCSSAVGKEGGLFVISTDESYQRLQPGVKQLAVVPRYKQCYYSTLLREKLPHVDRDTADLTVDKGLIIMKRRKVDSIEKDEEEEEEEKEEEKKKRSNSEEKPLPLRKKKEPPVDEKNIFVTDNVPGEKKTVLCSSCGLSPLKSTLNPNSERSGKMVPIKTDREAFDRLRSGTVCLTYHHRHQWKLAVLERDVTKDSPIIRYTQILDTDPRLADDLSGWKLFARDANNRKPRIYKMNCGDLRHIWDHVLLFVPHRSDQVVPKK